jgi:hypothetical protein
MPSPKSGTAGNAVSPAAPTAPQPADDANPGQVDQVKAQQIQTQTGKYGSTPTTPYDPAQAALSGKTSWIEIKLVDKKGNPVPRQAYRVVLPDGQTVAEGTLDKDGFARVEGIDDGNCKISFPKLDQAAWKRK